MANNIIKRVWNQNKMVNIEALEGMAFQAEDGGHTFEISGVDDSGNPVALSGPVAGVFVRPDNSDIALSGTASEGKIYVTLSDACYAVPGKFGLTIFVTADSKKTAVYAAIGTVVSTSSGGVAGDTPQDVVDLINAIEAAVATIPASYSGLMADIAPTYSNSALYAVGQHVYYNGDLYRCTTAITTAESWTAAHWTQAVLGVDVADIKNDFSNDLDSIFGAKIVSLNIVKGKYYNLNGESVDLSNPTTLADYESFYCPCSSGDLFVFNCIGQTAARAYAFASSNGTILKRANAGARLNNHADIAPENSAYVIVNNQLTADNPVKCLVYKFNPKYFTNDNKIVPIIKNGDDLNNYIVSGNYLITRSASYDDIGNMPANIPGKLIVIENDAGVVVQW